MTRVRALLAAALVLVLVSDHRPHEHSVGAVGGPLAWLLASSTDLGPARGRVQLTVALHSERRPEGLINWAERQHLSVNWRPGDDWAVLAGAPADMANSFRVAVHDYRGQRGQTFYASPQQPSVPPTLGGEISGLGRILGYTPHHLARPPQPPLTDTPKPGLSPGELLSAYNATGLTKAGFNGKGATIVFFEFDGFDQDDLDSFATLTGLPEFTPTVVGGQSGEPHGETVMDLEVAHAIAPDAHLVVVNARPTLEGDGNYQKIGRMVEDADRQFPGAVWSLSIGWACDKLLTAADLAPVRAALTKAQSHGTTAFDATGDNGGLQCKGGEYWLNEPGAS